MAVSRARLVAALVLAAAMSACSTPPVSAPPVSQPESASVTVPSASPSAEMSASPQTSTADYLPGLAATIHLPAADGPADLVVLVPGGGWSSADPTGLAPLADDLAEHGITAVTTTYSTTATGAQFPTPVDDVACAVRWSAQAATDNGRPPSRIIVLGHSAGGHLASLVATSGGRFGAECADPAVPVDGLIGVAGVYDVSWAGSFLSTFFGGSPEEVPTRWEEGDPMWWVTSGKADLDGLRILLVHGDADDTVPVSVTTDYAAVLTAAGDEPQVHIVPGQTHLSIFEADVIGPTIQNWLDDSES